MTKIVLPGFFLPAADCSFGGQGKGRQGDEKRKIRIKRYALIVNANPRPHERQLDVEKVR